MNLVTLSRARIYELLDGQDDSYKIAIGVSRDEMRALCYIALERLDAGAASESAPTPSAPGLKHAIQLDGDSMLYLVCAAAVGAACLGNNQHAAAINVKAALRALAKLTVEQEAHVVETIVKTANAIAPDSQSFSVAMVRLS